MFEVSFACHKENRETMCVANVVAVGGYIASNEAKFIQYEHMHSNAVILKITPILSCFNRRLDGW